MKLSLSQYNLTFVTIDTLVKHLLKTHSAKLFIAVFCLLVSYLSAAQQNGLSLDSLMGNSESEIPAPIDSSPDSNDLRPQAESSGLSLDIILGGLSESNAAQSSLDLGTIHEGRAILEQQRAYADLQSLDGRLSNRCACVGSNSCYDLASGFQFDQVISAAQEASVSLNDTIERVCQSWPGPGTSQQSMSSIETRMEIADKIMTAMNQVDGSAQEVRNQLAQQEDRIRSAIAQQQEMQNPDFNWGQFAAMTVGAVAGGVGSLDATQQAEIFSSITMDSMNGGGTMSNFQGTMDSLNAELASMQTQTQIDVSSGWESYDINGSVNGLALETQMINEAAEDMARTLMGEEVDTSNRSYAVQSSTPDPTSLLQGLGSTVSTPSSNVDSGSANGFDPAMRPGGATNYDLVGNSSGIQGSSTPASGGSGDDYINETYSFTCPGGSQATVPIVTTTQQCATAMKRYARVYSCNLFEEFEAVEREMNSLCANDIFE